MSSCERCGTSIGGEYKFCPSCGTIVPSGGSQVDSLLGATFNEKYRLIERIGSGSMGTVYRAEHLTLQKPIAIKILHRDLQVNDASLRRFQQEGIAAGKFTHPNAIQIFDFDRTQGGLYYLCMEFVEGPSLRAHIHEKAPLPAGLAAAWTRQMLSVLEAAHGHGLVHRDLKPDNILVVPLPDGQETIKVLDFGLSKLVDRSPQASLQTQTGQIPGTPLYMAPEQFSGGDVDGRADLYAAGIILFEMLTGEPPFRGENLLEILAKHTTEPLPPLESVRPVPARA